MDASFLKTCGCNAHDAMMKCNKKIVIATKIIILRIESRKPVSGCYNSPPLIRELAPRSRKETDEEVILSCFFDKRVKPRNLGGCKDMRKGTRDKKELKHFG
jgi:hypothetical protein